MVGLLLNILEVFVSQIYFSTKVKNVQILHIERTIHT